MLRFASVLFFLCLLSSPGQADNNRTLTIKLLDNHGDAIAIGSLNLFAQQTGYKYRLHLDHSRFTDHFLSMKEMKCLEGKELWCHLPYPYASPRLISADDLRWLEHDLLFLFKRPGEFGADFWNGIYYRLSWQGDHIVGTANAVDLNLLASPPENHEPPLGQWDIEPVDPQQRWLTTIRIR
ncbi:hypothetical protein [Motiliproteus sediminis]|uniref:hypothetical protein n=1 Tax=Motiliproteus sediminis TaxID=1468178 RepID=UPI001AEFEE01|nr:hypothetical protein [Motiliproteus sediminis]